MTEEIKEQNDHNHSLSFINDDPTYPEEEEEEEEEEETFVLAKTSKEKSSFRTIEDALNQLKIMIRRIHETNAFYICSHKYWKQKVNHYMEHIGVFSLIAPMTTRKTTAAATEQKKVMNDSIQRLLTNINENIILTLHTLFHCQAITREQYEQMIHFNQSVPFDVNQLYFIPKLQHDEIFIQPMVTSYIKEPIKVVASFLNLLLRPLIEQVIHSSTSLSTANEAIVAFELYTKQGYLRSTTLLTSIYIHDLSHTLPHSIMIEGLEKFLHTYLSNGQIEGTSTTTMIELVQLVLENQFYIYENNLYRQTAGGPMQTFLIRALIDIYLFYLQDDLVSILYNRNEIFGRSLNQIFFTWNGTKDELMNIIDQNFLIKSKYIHPRRITTLVDHQIQYLDVELSHYQGILQTRVYHNSMIEPHTLPYIWSTNSIAPFHLKLLRIALIRAILYCSNAIEFEKERLFIDLSFLINDVSLDLTQQTYQNFLIEFEVFLRNDTCIDEETYQYLRQRIRKYHQQRASYFQRERRRRRKQRQYKLIKK